MKALSIGNAEVMKVAIEHEILRSDESRYDHRLHGVLLVSHGLDCYTVAEYLGQNPTTVQRWVHRFENKGFAGLREGGRPGRPSSLNDRGLASIGEDLRQNPRELGYSQNLWDGKLLSHHLQSMYGISLGVRQCQRLFGQLGFRRRKPRPVIAKADPEEQAAFKKTGRPGKG